jgi:hypothetical protein
VVINKTTANTNSSALDVAGTLNVGTDLYALTGISYIRNIGIKSVAPTSTDPEIIIDAASGSSFIATNGGTSDFPNGGWTLKINTLPTTVNYTYIFYFLQVTASSIVNKKMTNVSITGHTILSVFSESSRTSSGAGWVYEIKIFVTSGTTYVSVHRN